MLTKDVTGILATMSVTAIEQFIEIAQEHLHAIYYNDVVAVLNIVLEHAPGAEIITPEVDATHILIELFPTVGLNANTWPLIQKVYDKVVRCLTVGTSSQVTPFEIRTQWNHERKITHNQIVLHTFPKGFEFLREDVDDAAISVEDVLAWIETKP